MLPKDQLSSRDVTTDTDSHTEPPSLEPACKLETVLRKALVPLAPPYTQPLHTHLVEIFMEMVAFKPRLYTSIRPAQAKAPSPTPPLPTPLSSTQQGLRRVQDFVNNVSDRHYSLFLLLRVESSGCPEGRLSPAKQLASALGTLNSGCISSQAWLL